MTKKDIDDIISIICPNDEDFEKPIISPAYLKKELETLALEQEPCEDWYDVPSDEMTLEQARQAVKDLRKKLLEHFEQDPFMNKPCVANQVCREDKVKVLDKIRAEIEAKCCITAGRENDAAITLHDVFEIINKYKVESEEQA